MSRPEPRPDRPPIEVRIRDLDKIRERAPLRVEPRHIRRTLLLVLGLVGLAFAGGFLLGSGMMSPREPMPPHAGEPARVVLAAPLPDDPASEALPSSIGVLAGSGGVAGEAGLPSGSVVPVPVPEPVPASAPVVVPAPAPEPVPISESAGDPQPAVLATAHALLRVELPDPRAGDIDLAPGGRRGCEPHVQAVGLPVPWSVVRVSDPGAECSRLSPADACVRVEAVAVRVEPEPGAAPPERAPPKPARRFQVQVRAYQDEQAANAYASSLVDSGYPARVVPFVDARGKHWFRIRIGRYNSQAEAQAFSREFNQRHNEQSVTVEVP